jgi:hypothetical protein
VIPVDTGGRAMGVGAVLTEGRRLFVAGLTTAFPWVLAAELLQELPGANPPSDILSMDLMQIPTAGYLVRALIFGCLQAFLYGMAILQLARLAGETSGGSVSLALRALPGVFIGYLLYSLVVLVGLGVTLLCFVLSLLLLGAMPAVLISLISLAPTAMASTALAFFIYPAVLEGRGPFAALGRSARLARAGWVQATVVVSVPALALLFAWFVGNGAALMHSFTTTMTQLANVSPDASLEQLQTLLTADAADKIADRSGWQLAGALAGAFAWWYTLAVCYAQYSELKARAAVRTH